MTLFWAAFLVTLVAALLTGLAYVVKQRRSSSAAWREDIGHENWVLANVMLRVLLAEVEVYSYIKHCPQGHWPEFSAQGRIPVSPEEARIIERILSQKRGDR